LPIKYFNFWNSHKLYHQDYQVIAVIDNLVKEKACDPYGFVINIRCASWKCEMWVANKKFGQQ